MRVGIVGMGYGAAVLLPAVDGVADLSVTALADSGSGRARRIAAERPAMRACDAAALVAADDVDLVIAAVPPQAQAAVVSAALDHGKAVLCEKPLGRDAAEARRLAERAAGAVAAVSLQFRYDPGIRAVKAMIDAGQLGAVQRIDVTWLVSGAARADRPWSWRNDAAAGGGIVADFAVHVLDYLTWMTGAPVSAVSGRTAVRVPSRPSPDGRPRLVTAADECDLALRLGESIAARVTVSNVYPLAFGHRVEVHGSDGRLTLHHRPLFDAAARSLVLETAAGREPLAIAEVEPAGADARVFAAARLIADLRRRILGEDRPDLPSFAQAAALRELVARIDALAGAGS